MKNQKDQSVSAEPHLQPETKAPRPTPQGMDFPPGLEFRGARFTGQSPDDIEHTVWDEPGVAALSSPSEDAFTYSNWLEHNMAAWSEGRAWQMTFLLALLSGPWACVAIFLGGGHNPSVFNFMLTCCFAPLIYEIAKISLFLWAIEKRPYYFTGWFQIFLGTMVSATIFVSVFNAVSHWFFPPTRFALLFDWTAYLTMHLVASFLAACGLELVWRRAITLKEPPRLESAYRWFMAAFLLHAAFATVMFVFDVVYETKDGIDFISGINL